MSGSSSRGKRAVVVGATGGVGEAIATAWVEAGGRVALVGRDEARLAELAAAHPPGSAACVRHDLESEGAEPDVANRIGDALGGVDALIHAAGVHVHGADAGHRADEVGRQMQVNALGPARLTRALLPLLVADGGGDVVFLNSSVLRYPRAEVGGYGMSKGALLMLAETLRQEINPHGVRVTTVVLGRTATRMTEEIADQAGHPFDPGQMLAPEEVAAAVLGCLALPRGAEVTDLHLRPARPPTPVRKS